MTNYSETPSAETIYEIISLFSKTVELRDFHFALKELSKMRLKARRLQDNFISEHSGTKAFVPKQSVKLTKELLRARRRLFTIQKEYIKFFIDPSLMQDKYKKKRVYTMFMGLNDEVFRLEAKLYKSGSEYDNEPLYYKKCRKQLQNDIACIDFAANALKYAQSNEKTNFISVFLKNFSEYFLYKTGSNLSERSFNASNAELLYTALKNSVIKSTDSA